MVATATALAVIAASAVLAGGPTVAAAGARATGCGVLFTKQFARRLSHEHPHQRVTASVIDVRTGCRYELHPGMSITTASVVKAQVLGAVLLKAQGRQRSLTNRERRLIFPMIRWSYNEPFVTDLYDDVGGVAAMNRFCRRMHAFHTINTEEYGATVTTAADRTNIALRMLYGDGPLHRRYRNIAWHYMSNVNPTQRWGITAGVHKGWSVALKNGFYPMSGHGWRVGSTGFVRAPGTAKGIAITVMTDQDASQMRGIREVEKVSRWVESHLATGPVARRVVTRARCLSVTSPISWQTAAHRLGTSDWQAVRQVSGGNPYPLHGQRVCSNRLSPA